MGKSEKNAIEDEIVGFFIGLFVCIMLSIFVIKYERQIDKFLYNIGLSNTYRL